jgi:hypothetical protein
MRLRGPIVIAVVLTGHWLAASNGSPKPDPFEFLRPAIQFSADDKHQLDERGIVLRILPASGHELATMVAASLNTTPDAFVAKIRNMPALKKGPHVPQIDKFSASPAIEDLQHLTLDDSDIQAIDECRPKSCGLKLNPDEIERLHRAQAAGTPTDSNERVQREFRQVVLDRAKSYLAAGTLESKDQFQALMQHSPFVLSVPQLVSYLDRYPSAPLTGTIESFLYWSKETYAWKPMVTVTHLTIVRNNGDGPLPEVLVISRDIFASRYTGGSLVVTALVRDPNSSPTQRYVVYVNRTWVDGIRALWRPFVEYRVKSQAKKVFADVRDRLERPGELSTQ